jgi:hypothetical protein
MHYTVIVDSRVDRSTLSKENFYSACVLRLPFRMRVGVFYEQVIKGERHSVRLAFLNTLDLPDEAATDAAHREGEFFRIFQTSAVAVVPFEYVSSSTIEAVKAGPSAPGAQPPRILEHYDHHADVLDALNQFTVAYSLATREWFGGVPLRMLRHEDLWEYVTWDVVLVLPKGYLFEREDYVQLIQLRSARGAHIVATLTGEFHDFGAEVLQRIPAYLSAQEQHIYFELAFEARSRMIAADFRGGLLLAVAALEGAHAAMVQACFANRFQRGVNSSRHAEDFLRGLGMSRALEITPALFLGDADRPDPALVKKCLAAISCRNEIMHALRNGRGEYKARLRSTDELSKLTVAVLDLTDFFIAAAKALQSDTAKS